jgi:hypothetical protein
MLRRFGIGDQFIDRLLAEELLEQSVTPGLVWNRNLTISMQVRAEVKGEAIDRLRAKMSISQLLVAKPSAIKNNAGAESQMTSAFVCYSRVSVTHVEASHFAPARLLRTVRNGCSARRGFNDRGEKPPASDLE